MPMPRKSFEEHELANTRPEYSDEIIFPAGRPKMPSDLGPVAEAEWKRLVPKLCRRKQLTKADASALEIYCRIFARWKKVEALAAERPISETCWLDKKGDEHIKQDESPASKIASRLESQMRAYLTLFSATPVSRKLTKPDTKSKPDLSKTDAAILSREAAAPIAEEPEPDLDAILARAEKLNL
jgi:P27 family predicted phage terminase small subunit